MSGVDYLLRNAARYPLLTPHQETVLGRQIRAWQDWPDGPELAPLKVRRAGKRALDRFVCSNIRLAYSIARRYEGRGVPLEDLTQSAIAGLIVAYRRFCPELGYRSSSYATWYGRYACQVAIATQAGVLRLPMANAELLGRIITSQEKLQRRLGRQPTLSEWADESGLSEQKLLKLRQAMIDVDVLSLDRPCPSGNGTLADFCPSGEDPDLLLYRQDLTRRLSEAIGEINDLPTRAVIRLRHLDDGQPSLARVAQILHLKRQTVARLEREGLAALKFLLKGDSRDLLEALSPAIP